ncbi:MAG TPA: DUF5709 domain-containing protein [Streptosporangiaceae bacterium]|nr:DUF5709 domain-containing protein [Streptosporangiaceae bacterium]
MPDEWRHESADLADYEVLDTLDTLGGAPGDDPLDRGVATPERWSAAMKFGSTAAEQQSGRSLDQSLGREDPDENPATDVNYSDSGDWDENATDDDIGRLEHEDVPDPRTGRLVPADDDAVVYPGTEADAVARDAGIDSGGATAEEAAMHLLADGQSD